MGSPEMVAVAVGSGGRIDVTKQPRPVPGPGEVRLQVSACGICGSDVHLRAAGLFAPGTTPGHEFAGVVDSLGPDVEGVNPGDAVAVEPFHSCGSCRECRHGWDPRCSEARLIGLAAPGGMSEYVVAPARRLYPLATDLPGSLASLAEPAAVVVRGLRRIGTAPQRLLILGAGSLGLMAILAARRLGVGEIWITARHPHQQELARALGADRVLDAAEASAEALQADAREAPIDAVLESVGGSADTIRLGGAVVRPGGMVSVLGVFMGEVRIDPLPLMMKEATLAWSYCYHRSAPEPDFARAVALLDAERDRAALLNTHPLPLTEAARGFDLAADRSAGVVKVSLLP